MFISMKMSKCAIDYIARLALDCPMGLVSYAATPSLPCSIPGQYPVSVPTITSSSDVCQVVSQESPIFSCNDNGILVR